MRYGCFILAIVLLQLYPSLVLGYELRLVPSIAIKEEYNSNIFLSADNVKTDFITTLSPGIEMTDRTGRMNADLNLRLDRLEFAGNPDFDAINQMYDGKFHYLISPLLDVSAEAHYARYPNPTLEVSKTGIAMVPVPWEHITSSLSANYKLDEKTTALTSYDFGGDYFESQDYRNDTSHEFHAELDHDFSRYLPALKGFADVGYGRYYFFDSSVDNITGVIGFSRDLSETWSAKADAGVRYTSSEVSVPEPVPVGFLVEGGQEVYIFEMVQEQFHNSGWGWVADVSLKYNGEKSSGDLTYSRDIAPAYGLEGAAQSNALALSAQYRFTGAFTALFTSGYTMLKSNASEFSAQAIDQKVFRIDPGVRYKFSRDLSAEAGYEYVLVKNPGSEADRHIFSVRLDIRRIFGIFL